MTWQTEAESIQLWIKRRHVECGTRLVLHHSGGYLTREGVTREDLSLRHCCRDLFRHTKRAKPVLRFSKHIQTNGNYLQMFHLFTWPGGNLLPRVSVVVRCSPPRLDETSEIVCMVKVTTAGRVLP